MTKKSSKYLGLIILVIILGGLNIVQFYYFTILNKTTPQEDVPVDMITLMTGDKESYIGKTLTIDGYYIQGGDNMSLLITDPIVFENNSLESDNYMVIGGEVPLTLTSDQGAQIHLKGRITWENETEDLLAIGYSEHKLIKKGGLGHLKNHFINPAAIEHAITPFIPTATKYAVLISGGIKPSKAYARYWNDITAMYFILTWLYGYEPENIYVVYKDGIAENGWAPAHGPATHAFIQNVFTELEGKMDRFDDLFIYTTNHGGTGGLCLWGPLDNSVLTPAELNNMLDPILYNQMIIVMEQCKSGVFIQTLSQARRVILTACSPYQNSAGCDTEGPWDEFLYHFMCAVAFTKINGDPGVVDADTNNDNKVSMYEAFMYASAEDSRLENPYYDDDGDGGGMPAIFLGLLDPSDEGAFGLATFL